MAENKLNLTQLKVALRKKSEYELVEEIATLYKKFNQVKEYYQASFFNNDEEVLEKYKNIVRAEYIEGPRNSFPKMRASVARKAISDYKKVSCSDHGLADLMLTYVEAGIICTLNYGDIDENFYISMERMFESALKFIVKQGLVSDFIHRIQQAVEDTADTGWGFGDQLEELYDIYIKDVHMTC